MSEYKKMAGTAAVFIKVGRREAAPVERDGMVWQGSELHVGDTPKVLTEKLSMANALALEGLEDYDPPTHGDKRYVSSLALWFVYLTALKGWVQYDE